MRLRLTALELAVISVLAGGVGLCVLVIPSHVSASVSAALAIGGLGLAGVAYRWSDNESSARTTAKAGAIVAVVALVDIVLGLGYMW